MRTLNCPRCDEPMETRSINAGSGVVTIDVCATGCAGIWLDEHDMQPGFDVTDDLQQAALTPCRTPDCGKPAACPICHELMERYRWNYTSPVTLDQCPAGHGTWIDGGEVQVMEEFEERDVLPADQQAKLRARLGMERLEMAGEHLRPVSTIRTPLFTLLEAIWRRFP
jgi:Zn-finger nucleic acid-binding protein